MIKIVLWMVHIVFHFGENSDSSKIWQEFAPLYLVWIVHFPTVIIDFSLIFLDILVVLSVYPIGSPRLLSKYKKLMRWE